MIATYCPGCNPHGDPIQMLVVWCSRHEPSVRGSDDDRVAETGYIDRYEAGGSNNARWCDLLHRGVVALVAMALLAGCVSTAAPPVYLCLGGSINGQPAFLCRSIEVPAESGLQGDSP